MAKIIASLILSFMKFIILLAVIFCSFSAISKSPTKNILVSGEGYYKEGSHKGIIPLGEFFFKSKEYWNQQTTFSSKDKEGELLLDPSDKIKLQIGDVLYFLKDHKWYPVKLSHFSRVCRVAINEIDLEEKWCDIHANFTGKELPSSIWLITNLPFKVMDEKMSQPIPVKSRYCIKNRKCSQKFLAKINRDKKIGPEWLVAETISSDSYLESRTYLFSTTQKTVTHYLGQNEDLFKSNVSEPEPNENTWDVETITAVPHLTPNSPILAHFKLVNQKTQKLHSGNGKVKINIVNASGENAKFKYQLKPDTLPFSKGIIKEYITIHTKKSDLGGFYLSVEQILD